MGCAPRKALAFSMSFPLPPSLLDRSPDDMVYHFLEKLDDRSLLNYIAAIRATELQLQVWACSASFAHRYQYGSNIRDPHLIVDPQNLARKDVGETWMQWLQRQVERFSTPPTTPPQSPPPLLRYRSLATCCSFPAISEESEIAAYRSLSCC